MKTDTYTKIILTIIAIALSILVLQNGNLVTSAYAEGQRLGMIPVNPDGSINVNVKSMPQTIDVNIESCEPNAFYKAEPIEVKIKD
jgi:hypothetical protein